MAIETRYDDKIKKIIIMIDYDPKKKYPDSKSKKTFMVATNGSDTKVPGAPNEDVRVGVNCYIRKPKGE